MWLLRKGSNAYGHRCVYECICMVSIRSRIIAKHFHGMYCFIGWSLCSACITLCRAGRWPLRFDAEALRSHGIKLSIIRHTLLCHTVLRYHLRREHAERAAFADHAVKKGHVRRNESQKRHRKDSPRGRSALGPCCSLCMAWPPSRAECVPYRIDYCGFTMMKK